MSYFTLIHCQDARTAAHLQDLGLAHAAAGVNLKSLSGPLPYDTAELQRLQSVVADRPVWLAASTHPGEDEIMLAAHTRMSRSNPDALLILVPRHPERAHAIEALIAETGLAAARRSTGMTLTPQTRVYLADTLGEMGLWYALAPLTCLCGSFTDVGGHNPYEPAYAGSAIVHGPLYRNFADTYEDLKKAEGAIEVTDADHLGDTLCGYLDNPNALDALREKSRAFALAQADVLAEFADTLSNALNLR